MAQPPIDKIKTGNLSATLWQNTDSQGQPFYTCTFSRAYTDAEGNWHDSNSFGRADLLRLSKLADQAHSRLEFLAQQDRAAEPKPSVQTQAAAAKRANTRQR